jgi:hypothetical protein
MNTACRRECRVALWNLRSCFVAVLTYSWPQLGNHYRGILSLGSAFSLCTCTRYAFKDAQSYNAGTVLAQGPDYTTSIKRLQHTLPRTLHDIQILLRHPLITSAADYYKQFVCYIRSVCAPTLDARVLKKSTSTGTPSLTEPGALSMLSSLISVPLAPLRAQVAVVAPESDSELTSSWDIIVEPSDADADGAEVSQHVCAGGGLSPCLVWQFNLFFCTGIVMIYDFLFCFVLFCFIALGFVLFVLLGWGCGFVTN